MSAVEGWRATPSRMKLEWGLVVVAYAFLVVIDVVGSNSLQHTSTSNPSPLPSTTVAVRRPQSQRPTTAVQPAPSPEDAAAIVRPTDFVNSSMGNDDHRSVEPNPTILSPESDPVVDEGLESALPHKKAFSCADNHVAPQVPLTVEEPAAPSLDSIPVGTWAAVGIFLKGVLIGLVASAALATMCVTSRSSRSHRSLGRTTDVAAVANSSAAFTTSDATCQCAATAVSNGNLAEETETADSASRQLLTVAENRWVSVYQSLATAELETHQSLLDVLEQLGKQASSLHSTGSGIMSFQSRCEGEPTAFLSWQASPGSSSDGGGVLRSRSHHVRCNLESIAFGGGPSLHDSISQSLLGQPSVFGVQSAAGADVPSLDVSSILDRPTGTDAAAGGVLSDGGDGNDWVSGPPALAATNRPHVASLGSHPQTTKGVDCSHEWLFRVSTAAVSAWLRECEAHGAQCLSSDLLSSEVVMLRREASAVRSKCTAELDRQRQQVEQANLALVDTRMQQARQAECVDTALQERRMIEMSESSDIALLCFTFGQAIGAARAAAAAQCARAAPKLASPERCLEEGRGCSSDCLVQAQLPAVITHVLGDESSHPSMLKVASIDDSLSRGSSPAVSASAIVASEIRAGSKPSGSVGVAGTTRNSEDAAEGGGGSMPHTPTSVADSLVSTARDALLRESRLRHVAHMELRLMELEQRRVAAQAVTGDLGPQGVMRPLRSDSAASGASSGRYSQRSSTNNTPIAAAAPSAHGSHQQHLLQRPRGLRQIRSGTVSPLQASDNARVHEDVNLAADSGVSRRAPRSSQSTPTAQPYLYPPGARETHPYAAVVEPVDSPHVANARGAAPGRTTSLRSPSVSSSNHPLGMLQSSSTRSVSF